MKGQMMVTILNDSEEEIRQYLLHKHLRWQICKERVYFVHNIYELSYLLNDKSFICINFFFDRQGVVVNPDLTSKDSIQQLLIDSDIHLGAYLIKGFLLKKSLSGKKAYLKTLGEDGENIIRIYQ